MQKIDQIRYFTSSFRKFKRYYIDNKLNSALSICLVVDIWTNRVMADFLGLAAIIINNCFEQELLIIGMGSMTGNHSAENIKREIESLVNSFKCNKSKFHGKKHFLFVIYLFFKI